MKFFLCIFEDFNLAVPIDSVASLIVNSQLMEQPVVRDKEKGDIYFSLPHFFGSPGELSRHGLILKEQGQVAEEGGRKILLVTAVERELFVPDEEIFPLPGVLLAMDGVSVITGIRFTGDSGVMLFIDPQRLIPCMLNNEKSAANIAGAEVER